MLVVESMWQKNGGSACDCVCVKKTHPNPKGTWEAKSFTQSRKESVPHLSSALAESEDRATPLLPQLWK